MSNLSPSNRKTLLQLARNAIEIHLATGDPLNFKTEIPEFNQKRGCFVTLRKNQALRGSVGTFDTQEILSQNVIRMAISAGFQDPRFPPLTKEELSAVKVEISLLGPLEKIQNFEEIKIGKHGVYIKQGNRVGSFLPEMAVEQNWNVMDFVMHCAREKAKLSPEEISQAEIYRYEVEKFKE